MSDGDVRASIEQMEAWIADPNWVPDPEALAQWDNDFHSAMVSAAKGEGWVDLMAKARALGRDLESRTARLEQLRDLVKAELDSQQRGNRALKGYGASTR